MHRASAPITAPVHRLAPAVRAFFGHRPAGEHADHWPAPFRALVRRIQDFVDPPLQAPELHGLLRLLASDSERAVVGRWLVAVPRLRRSDMAVVEDYFAERDADLTPADLAVQLAVLQDLARR